MRRRNRENTPPAFPLIPCKEPTFGSAAGITISSHEIVCAPHGESRTRTGDTTIFSRVLYQLS